MNDETGIDYANIKLNVEMRVNVYSQSLLGWIADELKAATAKERERCALIARNHYDQEAFFGNEYASQKCKEIEADILDPAKWRL